MKKFIFFSILTLPLIAFYPFFFPPSWTKMLALKLLLLIWIGVLMYQILFKFKKLPALSIKKNPIVWAFGAYFLIFLLSSFFSIDPYFSFWGSPERGGGFINLLFLGLFSLIATLTLETTEWRKAWSYALVIGGIISFLGILSFYGVLPSLLAGMDPRSGATIGNPIPLGIYLLMLLPVAAALFFTESQQKKKYGYAAGFGLLLLALFLTGSRGAYMGFLAAAFYFLLLFPKQTGLPGRTLKTLKIAAGALLTLVILTVLYASYTPNAVPLLSENKISKIILPRLSIQFLSQEERFRTWGTVEKVIQDRPLLGWGMENLSTPFDQHFDPTVTPLGWWDRSHNTFLDAAVSAGIPGLLAYIALFGTLLWQLHRVKRRTPESRDLFMAHALQATLIGYGVANLFSIESFSPLLLFFLVVAHAMHLKQETIASETVSRPELTLSVGQKRVVFSVCILLAVIFSWPYIFHPFSQNVSLNTAKLLAAKDQCKQALEKIVALQLPQPMLGQYGVLESEQAYKQCIKQEPEHTLAYSQQALAVLEKALPTYATSSRLWILAGSMASTIAASQEDDIAKKAALEKSLEYYQKALSLSPKSQEVLLKMAWSNILLKDCETAEKQANQCIALDASNGGCYIARATAFICAKNTIAADADIQTAKELGLGGQYNASLQQLINAYLTIKDYKKVTELYELLIQNDSYNVQYRASLAEAYRITGQYEKARQAALAIKDVLSDSDLSPQEQEAVRKSVDAFLQSLPKQ